MASFSRVLRWDQQTIRLLQVIGQTMTNIQERIHSEQNLQVSEERLRLALQATRQGLYDLNLQTGEAVVTPEYAIMLGYDPGTFIETHSNWLERLHPDDLELVTDTYQAYITRKIPEYKVEFRQKTQSGDYKWILSLGKIVDWDGEGKSLRMLGTHTDITDRKQRELEQLQTQKIQQELTLLEQILETVLAGYWDWDIVTNEQYLSPAFKQMFGYADSELANSSETWQELILAEDLPIIIESFTRHVESKGKIPHQNEVRYRHKNGSIVWVLCSGQVIEWDACGNPLRMIGCHIDITQQKQVERQLRKRDAHLKAAQRIAKMGSWEFDAITQEVIWSDEVFRIFGREIEAGTPSYQELLQYYHPDDRIYHVQVVEIAIATGKPYDLEGRLYGPDGSWVYVQARGETVLDKSGKVVQLVGTILDITERKLSEQKLLKLSDRLTLALKSGAIGTWDWDIISEGNIIWDDRMYEIYGLPNQRGAIFYEDWRRRSINHRLCSQSLTCCRFTRLKTSQN